MIDDGSLLRAYIRASSEAAFSQLVSRHLDLVYGTALKRLGGNVHRAQDLTQRVFSDLARKAAGLLHRKTLAGWLYLAARQAAAELMRAEQRRQNREYQAHLMQEANSEHAPDWLGLKPLLDQALSELKDQDRDLLLLRYFEVRTFTEIADSLGLTEDAARRRCDRATQRLRAALAHRGVTSTASALAVALSNEAVVAAPAGLSIAITGIALAEAASTAATSVGATMLHLMSTPKIMVGVTGVMIAIIAASGFHHRRVAEESRQAWAAANSRLRLEREPEENKAGHFEQVVASAPITPLPSLSNQAGAPPAFLPAPPELLKAYRSMQYAFWNREFEAFIADRHMTPEQIAQFDAALDPSPQIEIFRDDHGRFGFSLVPDNIPHQRDENLRALLGPDGFDAMKAFKKYNEPDLLAGDVSATALLMGIPMASDQVQQLAELFAHCDRGRTNRMAGTPNLYAWETMFKEARAFLEEDQLSALKAVSLQTAYRMHLADVMYPKSHLSKETP